MPYEENLDNMVARRNKRLLRFFTQNGYNVRITGDTQKPTIVLDNMIVLSCFVRNSDLHFTKEPLSTEIVKSFKLTNEPEANKLEIEEAIMMGVHRPAYKVKLKVAELFVVGFNYQDSENSIGRYPVFGKHNPKVYFDREYAVKLADSLVQDGYEVALG